MNTRTLHTKRRATLPLLMALAAASPALAQIGPTQRCGSEVKPEEVAQAVAQQESGLYVLPSVQDGSLFHVVRVKMHIVRMTNHTGGIAESSIQASFVRANSELAASRIFLIAQDDVDYIDDDNFYLNINTQAEIDALRAVRPQPDMLNIYFTQNLSNESGSLCGISSFTFSTSQGIAMANSCTNGDSVLSHEIGHYFDLFHTHETAFGAECVNESNCETTGDLICDTPADPCLVDFVNLVYRVNAQCQYLGGPMDPCNNVPYTPNTHNTMSYSYSPCLNHFTAQQSVRAEAALLNGRASHIVTSPVVESAIHLDTSAAAGGNGTWPSPINSFTAAVAATSTGGVLAIARAAANEGAMTLNRPMFLYNSGPESGVVRLGAP